MITGRMYKKLGGEDLSEHQFDIGIIGCGPAGLSAAVNAKNKNRDIVVLGAEICSPP